MHIVIRSSQARGAKSFLKTNNRLAIQKLLTRQAKIHGVRLYRHENVGNHLHILVRVGHRSALLMFLRSITGLIARIVLGAQRGKAKGIQFWDARPFSRVVAWGKAYQSIHRYFDKNRLQALGFNLPQFKRDLALAEANSS